MAETEVILAHPTFRNSKRCVALLKHLVAGALNGDQDGEKERTLGIEVFGRASDYDTNAEPVVRMTANDIRKRLAQFYQETHHSPVVRIRLIPGSYLPHFDFAERQTPQPALATNIVLPEAVAVSFIADQKSAHLRSADPTSPRKERWPATKLSVKIFAGLTLLAVAGVLVLVLLLHSHQPDVWGPILSSPEPVIVCVGELNTGEADGDWASRIAKIIAERRMPQLPLTRTQFPAVPLVDAVVSGRITSLLTAHHKDSSIRGSSELTLGALRQGPVVLVGAFDNPWALILLSNLRYHVRVDPDTQDEWIEDMQKPTERAWKGSGHLGFQDTSTDYAIITRVLDQDTGKWILAVGGLGMHGTEAAVDLLLAKDEGKLLPPEIRASKKNFQVVLQTTVIGGNIGSPQVLASYVW